MKKLFVCALIIMACFTFNAFGQAKAKKIGIAHYSTQDQGAYIYAQVAQQYAKSKGYDVVFLDANNDAQKQATQFEDLINMKVDAILTVPVDAAALTDSVIKANKAGIPVAMMDRSTQGGQFLCLVESDNVEHGYQAGLAMVDIAAKQGIAVKDLKVLELQGDLASSAGLERSQGFQKAAKEKGFKILQSLPTMWNTDKAYNCVLDGLQAHPDANAIFLPSDNICCNACVSALKQLKLLVPAGQKGHIVITSVDGGPDMLAAIKAGNTDAMAAQQVTTMPVKAIDYITQYFNGQMQATAGKVEKFPPAMGTKDNINSKDLWANSIK